MYKIPSGIQYRNTAYRENRSILRHVCFNYLIYYIRTVMFLLRVLIFTLETILYGYQLIHSKSVNRQLVKQ